MSNETLITCPAPLEMLRAGSVCRLTEDWDHWRAGQQVVYLRRYRSWALVAVLADDDAYHQCVGYEGLAMDLTDATGRAHAAWWVANTFNMNSFCVAPILSPLSQPWGTDWILEADGHEMAFGVQASMDDLRDSLAEEDWSDDPMVTGLIVVPTLADLDPTDDTRLPDGSRVVDALALKAVVEHLIAQGGA